MAKPTGLHVFLNVTNVEKSAAFYEALGFKRTITFPPPMNVVGYDLSPGSTLLLGPSEPANDEETRRWLATRPLGAGVVIMPQVKDVDDTHAKARQSGAQVEQPPTLQPWGSRTLRIVDPDGYSLMFDEPTPAPRPKKRAAKKAKASKPAKASRRVKAAKPAKKAARKARRRG